jgi:hypothetical protein
MRHLSIAAAAGGCCGTLPLLAATFPLLVFI